MSNQNPTIIVGHLDNAELEKSINDLVDFVDKRTNAMADGFGGAMEKMKVAMKGFAEEQKKSVAFMKDAWKDLSVSFDAMAKATDSANESGGGSVKKKEYGPNTVGELEQLIAADKARRKEMELQSQELKLQNQLISEQEKMLKNELMTEEEREKARLKKIQEEQRLAEIEQKNNQKRIKYQFDVANTMPVRNLEEAERKLEALRRSARDMRTSGLFDEAQINRAEQAIVRIEKTIEKMRKKKPLSLKDVMGMDESSVEAISRKMQALKRVSVNPKDIGQVRELGNEYQRLSRLQAEMLGKGIQLTHSNNALAQSFGYIRNRLVYALTLGAATSFVKQLYEIRSQYELLERSLGVLVNSFEKGSQIFRELNAMAIESPFTLIELSSAAKQLTAYNFAANEVVETTRRIADISAALGVPMERLTYNLGQIRAQTVLTARDARDFANAGLPIVSSLAEHFSELEGRIVTTGDVYDRMSKKMVSYNDVMAVLNKMTDEGGKFFEFQAKQAETLKVQLANLNLAWNNALNEIGSSNQSLLTFPINALKTLLANWKEIDKIIKELVITYGIYRASMFAMTKLVGQSVGALKKQILAKKQARATELEHEAVVRRLTEAEIQELNTKKKVLQADYEAILAEKKLSAAQAMTLVTMNKRNVSLHQALINTNTLTAQQVQMATSMNAATIVGRRFMTTLKGIGASAKAMAASLWPMLLFTGVLEAFMSYRSYIDSIKELNNDLVENAKEASEDLFKYINNKGIIATREMAKASKLSAQEGEKAWIALRDKIGECAMASREFLTELAGIGDINERLSKGFDYADNIYRAKAAMTELGEETIKVTQDMLYGLFGEGLSSDAKDYLYWIKEIQKTGGLTSSYDLSKYKSAKEEFESEVRETAESINRFIVENNITNPIQINEILESIRNKIKEKNPEIKGELADIFDIELDRQMSNLTNGAIDKNTSLWTMFMNQIKHDSNSAFNDITEEIYNESTKLSDNQKEAIDNALEYFKKNNKVAYNELVKMVEDANKLKINIGIAFNVKRLTDFQNEVKKRIKDASSTIDFGNESFLPKESDSLVTWAKTQTDAIKSLIDANNTYANDNTEYSKNIIAANNKEIEQRKNLLALFGLTYEEEKKSKKVTDELGQALSKHVSIIDAMQKRYKEYLSMGVDSSTAMKKATKEYSKTLLETTKILEKFGFTPTKSGNDLVNMSVNDLKAYYESLSDFAESANNTKGIEALEKSIAKLNVELTKKDYITYFNGLESALANLKNEYELSLELDANPEVGESLASLFGIDTSNLPRTADDFAKRYTSAINKYLKDVGSDLVLKDLNLSDKELEDLDKLTANDKLNKKWFDLVKKGVEDVRKLRKKEADATIKEWSNLVQKYGELQSKILKIYRDSADEQVTIAKMFGTSEQQNRAIDISRNIKVAKTPEEAARLQKELNNFIADAFKDNTQANQIINASIRKQKELISRAIWDEFKEGDMYALIFDDLKRASTSSITILKSQLDELKSKVKESPESMKALMDAYGKLRDEMIERDPFGSMIESMNRWRAASTNVMIAQKNLNEALDEQNMAEAEVNNARKEAPSNVMRLIEAEVKLSNAKKKVAKATKDLADAQNEEADAAETHKKAVKESADQISKLVTNVKSIGDAIGGTSGKVISLIGDIANFVVFSAESMQTVSETASQAIQNIERASVILAIISAAIKLMQTLSGFVKDASDSYKELAEKQAEVNKLTDAVLQYRLAVIAARMEEENWFGDNGLKNLRDYFEYGKAAMDAYTKKMYESQAIYENESGNGWLTKAARAINPANWAEKLFGKDNAFTNIFGDFFGEVFVGAGFGIINDAIDKGLQATTDTVYKYKEGYVAAINNLRIETRKASKGFWGTGIGGKSQKTEDLISWVKKNLGFDLFEEDGMLNEEAYEVIMDKYSDKLVGETKETLEALKELKDKYDEYIEQLQEYVDSLYSPLSDNVVDAMWDWADTGNDALDSFKDKAKQTFRDIVSDMMKTIALSTIFDEWKDKIQSLYKNYSSGDISMGELMSRVAQLSGELVANVNNEMPVLQEIFSTVLEKFKLAGLDLRNLTDSTLSALQQGISGITETQASALEAYANIVSQNSFKLNELVTEIRDMMKNANNDVQTATFAQMLLQLQQSYQVQLAIQGILVGWSSPNGMAIRVEMN